ncbi:hypothetical protein [Burkholderia multivorans]|uniref:hypothetical protein n=1 Tax=Burkholderia multivorans TaxID=87883 RepID=UPI001B8ED094|nr:hypothetical protein [Burkholderia multivorans]MBR7900294.1 hypothetical protein [Burkholderia multivorans]
MTTQNAKSPAPEKASEEIHQRPEAKETAETILGADATQSNQTNLKSGVDVSRADALTDALKRLSIATIRYAQAPKGFNQTANEAFDERRQIEREILTIAASPVEQPAAAPIDERAIAARTDSAGVSEIILSTIVRAARKGKSYVEGYGKAHQFLKDAGLLVDGNAATEAAPSPADERAARDESLRGEVAYQLHTRNRFLDMPTTRAIVDSAFDAVIAKNTLPGARAASANETGAEGADECFIVIGHGESDIPTATIVARRADVLDAVLGMMYDGPCTDDAMRAEYASMLDDWDGDHWNVTFEIGGIDVWRIALSRSHAMAAEAVAIGEHDLSTSAGGRGYVAEFFAKRLRRHDFGRYIHERLAADFACALAQYLRDREAAPQPAQADARPTDDELWDQTLRERDEYHEAADKLAAAIAQHFGVDIGEHSNANCPWDEALEVIENAAPADARVGLTGALRRAREELSIVEWENDPPSRVVKLFDEIDALLATPEPEPRAEVTGWQPIETAPTDGTGVLLIATRHSMLMPDPEVIVGAYRRGWWSGPSTLSHVTHWMPLPAAPIDAAHAGDA